MPPDHSLNVSEKDTQQSTAQHPRAMGSPTTTTTKVAPNTMTSDSLGQPQQETNTTQQEGAASKEVADSVVVVDQATIERNARAHIVYGAKAKQEAQANKTIEKFTNVKQRLETKKRDIQSQMFGPQLEQSKRQALRKELAPIIDQIANADAEIKLAKESIAETDRTIKQFIGSWDVDYSQHPKPGESEHNFKIRTGLIQPLSNVGRARKDEPMSELEREVVEEQLEREVIEDQMPQSHRLPSKPGFQPHDMQAKQIDFSQLSRIPKRKSAIPVQKRPKKLTRIENSADVSEGSAAESPTPTLSGKRAAEQISEGRTKKYQKSRIGRLPTAEFSDSDFREAEDSASEKRVLAKPKRKRSANSSTEDSANTRRSSTDSAFIPSEDVENGNDELLENDPDVITSKNVQRQTSAEITSRATDDGDEASYQRRLKKWINDRSSARDFENAKNGIAKDDDARDEWLKPCPTHPDYALRDGTIVPGDIWRALYRFQRTGVEWLSELHAMEAGGIVADEMGLGKTIQAISMIASLHHSGKLNRPALIVCPATVMQQWVDEFHDWWPALRVSILHKTGSGMSKRRKSKDGTTEEDDDDSAASLVEGHGQKGANGILNRVIKNGHVLIVSYSGLEGYSKLLSDVQWDYVILDEGHKIKNPETTVTACCKQLQSKHRIILSGTPVQNNLSEFWSLYDFVTPMMLGSLDTFQENFEHPIKRGTYKGASNLHRSIGNKAAKVLKETISKHFLQRFKADVASDLPQKREETLFVRLAQRQADVLKDWLKSGYVERCMENKGGAITAFGHYRKLCNHPHLAEEVEDAKRKYGDNWGDYRLSGKMVITRELIYDWKKKGNKMLVFSQSKLILSMLEKMFKKAGDIRYLRMDGDVNIKERSRLVDKFNQSPDYDVFLLTTQVGGIGLNLTSANGVIIFDPHWNPSVDAQARERVYRIGQKKPVHIFKLIARGTIEENVFRKQIYKKVMSDKVLNDSTIISQYTPDQMKDLFTYNNSEDPLGADGDIMRAGHRIIGKSTNDARFFNGTIESGTGLDQVGAAHMKFARGVRDVGTKKRKAAVMESDQAESGTVDPQAADSPADVIPPNAKRQKKELSDFSSSVAQKQGVSYVQLDDDIEAARPRTDSEKLDNLFQKSGVYSVLSHENNAGQKGLQLSRQDEEAAKKMESELRAQVLQNQLRSRETAAGPASWTGTTGLKRQKQQPEAKKWKHGIANGNSRTGASSSSARPSREATPAVAPPPPRLTATEQRTLEYQDMIVAYMKAQSGAVPISMLTMHFKQFTKKGEGKLWLKALHNVAEETKYGNQAEQRYRLLPRYRAAATPSIPQSSSGGQAPTSDQSAGGGGSRLNGPTQERANGSTVARGGRLGAGRARGAGAAI